MLLRAESRPWIIYWILHALELLDALPEELTEQVIGETSSFEW